MDFVTYSYNKATQEDQIICVTPEGVTTEQLHVQILNLQAALGVPAQIAYNPDTPYIILLKGWSAVDLAIFLTNLSALLLVLSRHAD